VLLVAVLLGVSRSFVRKLHDSSRLPRPVRLGRAVRWRRAELFAWLQAGCPSRDRWEATGGNKR
jgi:excisionase family DNA binding protein